MGYSSLSTSRGDGNGSNCVPKKYNAANSIATYLPREGPETLQPTIKLLVLVVCIAPYLPREGPETTHVFSTLFLLFRIAPYLPREGPETD